MNLSNSAPSPHPIHPKKTKPHTSRHSLAGGIDQMELTPVSITFGLASKLVDEQSDLRVEDKSLRNVGATSDIAEADTVVNYSEA
jgi:hypothetical protein